jgi:hypothetical protein
MKVVDGIIFFLLCLNELKNTIYESHNYESLLSIELDLMHTIKLDLFLF